VRGDAEGGKAMQRIVLSHERRELGRAAKRAKPAQPFGENDMKSMFAIIAATACLCAVPAFAAPAKHFPSGGSAVSGPSPAYSAAVEANGNLYISGTTDGTDPDTGKKPADASIGAKVVMNNVKKTVEAAGYTMDDLVWLQIFAADLKDYADFNAVYRTYFKGPLPARAFIGAGSLLGGAHYEVMGIATKAK
jgi:2-iminobutanoate/2-iminopropanoate deaminase